MAWDWEFFYTNLGRLCNDEAEAYDDDDDVPEDAPEAFRNAVRQQREQREAQSVSTAT